ncbi:Uncharacterized protein APZ42_019092 [Daphnia magna]|uniref:Uncharacterized protein n=1 Tax=Daphnia magna TaxID=35525 RepID=A0A0P5BYY0_9CRUS|nr:Uncharacterized protein APZ42_019092 [Daphnia magna]
MYSNITNGTISVRCLSQQNKNLQQFLAELENWELNASNSVISFPPQTKFQEIFNPHQIQQGLQMCLNLDFEPQLVLRKNGEIIRKKLHVKVHQKQNELFQ